MPKKLTIDFVKMEFEEEEYQLLSDKYIGAYQKLNYICPYGHKHKISWAKWQSGRRCAYCANEKQGYEQRLTIDYVRAQFEEEGYELLTTVYMDNRHKLKYICPNSHEHSIAWYNWVTGYRCPACAGNARLTIDFIKVEFEKENYKLLSKQYINSYHKLDYVCPIGHKHNISWGSWFSGSRCPSCKSIKMSGPGNSSWKGGISCEPYCFEWSFKEFKDLIKERDDYTCQNPDCWRTSNRLCIHHVDYDKKNCGPSNLITLCNSCNARANVDREWHTEFYNNIMYKRGLINEL